MKVGGGFTRAATTIRYAVMAAGAVAFLVAFAVPSVAGFNGGSALSAPTHRPDAPTISAPRMAAVFGHTCTPVQRPSTIPSRVVMFNGVSWQSATFGAAWATTHAAGNAWTVAGFCY